MGAQCKHCHVEIRQFDYGLGPEWLHIGHVAGAGGGPAIPYKICRPAPVAEPLTIGEAVRIAEQLGGSRAEKG